MICCKSLLTLIYFCVFLPIFILSKSSSDRGEGSYTNASESRGSNSTVELGIRSLNQSNEECDCGEKSTSCKFDVNRKKTCTCEDNYAPKINSSNSEEYCEACYCENQAIACKFDSSGRRKCTCRKGYAPYVFRIDEVCVTCECGIDELACAVDYNGIRKCACGGDSVAVRDEDGFEKCEKCSCGPNSISCKMFYGHKNCNCSSGYVAKVKSPLNRDEECVFPEDPSALQRVAIYIVSVMCALIFVIVLMLIYRKYKKGYFFSRRRAMIT